MAGASLFFRILLQRYDKKNEQRKIATRLLPVLLVCYCNATAVLLVVVFSEAAILERQRQNSVQRQPPTAPLHDLLRLELHLFLRRDGLPGRFKDGMYRAIDHSVCFCEMGCKGTTNF